METKRLKYEKNSKFYSVGTASIFSIINKKTEQEVGEIIVADTGEICYCIEPEYCGCGYATEALGFAKQYAREEGLTPFLKIRTYNMASKAVARRNGFVQKGFLRYFELWKCEEFEMG